MGQTKSVCISSDGTQPVFGYSELAKATNSFSQRLEWREIYYGKLKDGRQISVEKLDQRTFIELKNMQALIISRLLPHRILVSIYGYANHKEDSFLLVHEYISNGSLDDHLHGEVAESRKVPWFTRLDIATDVANALAYLHNHEIIHGHVNSNNILLDENFCAKVRLNALLLAERVSDDDYEKIPFKFDITDQEYMLDVYDFGLVLCQLLSSKPAMEVELGCLSVLAYCGGIGIWVTAMVPPPSMR